MQKHCKTKHPNEFTLKVHQTKDATFEIKML